jgi:uroporphyrinogen-III synthase
MLKNLGCEVLNVPTIKITDPDDPNTIQNVLKNISAYNWIIFTSANAVRYFFKFKNKNDEDLKQSKIACIGKKTAETLNFFSYEPHLIPEIFSNRELINELQKYNIRGKHILLPVSNMAGDELQVGLKSLGAHVKKIEIYKNLPYQDSQWEETYKKIKDGVIDCITFYSPSALIAFVTLIGDDGVKMINDKKITIAVIGQSTAQAARKNNLHPEVIPPVSDDGHFVEALKEYFEI